MTVLRIHASQLGERWDVGFHTGPAISIPDPALPLSHVVDIRRGHSVSAKEYVGPETQRKVVPYIRISDLAKHTISKDSIKQIIDSENIPETARTNTGDVLFSIAGTIGKTAIVTPSFHRAVASSQIAILTPKDDHVYPEFLVRILEAKYVKSQLLRAQTGSFIRHLPLNELKRIRISVPSKEDQATIIQKMRDLETELEKSKEAQDKIKTELDSILGGHAY